MNRKLYRSAASAMVYLCIVVRIFIGIAVEYEKAYNASWICPIVGLLLCLPLILCFHFCGNAKCSVWDDLSNRCPEWLPKVVSVCFFAVVIYDCAALMRILAATSSFISLSSASELWLILPLIIVVFFSICLGAEAEGNSARIWLKLVPLLFVAVVFAQMDSYNPAWLAPALGGGAVSVVWGGLMCSGWLALSFLPWMISIPDKKRDRPLRTCALGVVTAAILLLVLQMLCPPIIETELSKIARIEIILSNNRVTHVLQMFLTLLWFGSLLHLISIEAVTAARFVHNIAAGLPAWGAALICSLAAGVLGISDWVAKTNASVYGYLFILISGPCAVMMCFFLKKKGDKHAKI